MIIYWLTATCYIFILITLHIPKQTFAINLFQKKMSFTGETSTIEKDAKYTSETKNIHFFSYNVYFVFQKIGNSQNILKKINFHIKAMKARIACLIFQQIVIFLKNRITKNVHTSIFTCAHYLLCGDPINNNSPWKLFRPGLNLSNVSITMEINESLHTFKASISREISKLTIVSKS